MHCVTTSRVQNVRISKRQLIKELVLIEIRMGYISFISLFPEYSRKCEQKSKQGTDTVKKRVHAKK